MKVLKLILLGIVVLLVLTSISAPFLIKSYLNKNGKKLVGRELHLEGLYHNPLTGYTRFRGFQMLEQNDTANFI